MAKFVETPLMSQYVAMKKKHPDAILLFRVGDFYETFSDDAITASEILGITLTRRANGKAASVELAGFPHHALDTYLPRLVRAGKRVAICEQLEDPKLTKKLVKRGITELVTPGVNTNDNALTPRENNFLAGIHITKFANRIGVAFLDISTGEFFCAQGTAATIDKLLNNFAPKELLRMRGTRQFCEENISWKCSVFELDDWVYTSDSAEERLLKQFSTASLKGFGVEDMPEAVIAAASLLYYLDLTQHSEIGHIVALSRLDEQHSVRLDRFTQRNLELLQPTTEGGRSLINTIDRTITPPGGRLLRNWIIFPLADPALINRRHDGVAQFAGDTARREQTRRTLASIGDLQRLAGKLAASRISPRELRTLGISLTATMALRQIISADTPEASTLASLASRIEDLGELAREICTTIVDDPPAKQSSGNYIRSGVDPHLDNVRELAQNSNAALEAIRIREIEATGITSLKIGNNNVFGYYIEVRNTHRENVPQTWIRKQTLVNAERYITPELKELEEKINSAQDQTSAAESRIFESLKEKCRRHIAAIQTAGAAVAETDCLAAFADIAEDYGYVRPVVDDSLTIDIQMGRHPVIERNLPPGEPYIANSVTLDNDGIQIMMITGPNMSGKSALLRQTALIVLMAQAGSYVPAESARIGVVDKIFTRVGASDNISAGESTFMLEMTEAASILNNMSDRSLIIFDELGRGTSTYDGISIAWSIVEHIHENGRCRPKTLFATHYHELNEMEKTFGRIRNFNVAVKEIEGKVVFIRRLEKGGTEHSFGIHVAKLAGLPATIVKRAGQVLRELESESKGVAVDSIVPAKGDVDRIATQREGYQMALFQLDDPLLSEIRDRLLGLDIDNLTPIQALNTLLDLQKLLSGKN